MNHRMPLLHIDTDMPLITYDRDDVKRWLSNRETYQLDDTDVFLLENHVTLQMLGHIRPMPTPICDDEWDNALKIAEWMKDNLEVDDGSGIASRKSSFWIQCHTGAVSYMNCAIILLCWDGSTPTEQQLAAAEWYLELEINPCKRLGMHIIPFHIQLKLYHRAVSICPDMIGDLVHNLYQVVASCRRDDIATGTGVLKDKIEEYNLFTARQHQFHMESMCNI